MCLEPSDCQTSFSGYIFDVNNYKYVPHLGIFVLFLSENDYLDSLGPCIFVFQSKVHGSLLQ